jgi:hypothetical protein
VLDEELVVLELPTSLMGKQKLPLDYSFTFPCKWNKLKVNNTSMTTYPTAAQPIRMVMWRRTELLLFMVCLTTLSVAQNTQDGIIR